MMNEMHLLFVCTGNTCRSPMAQAIADSMIRAMEPKAIAITTDSAGVAAGDGYSASAQAIEVLNERGIDLGTHRSKPLNLELIDWAQIIFTMTPAHAQVIIEHAPQAADKTLALDANHPVADPFGQPVEVYRQVADELETLIRSRLEEILR
jgi:protein arginine phosphatase